MRLRFPSPSRASGRAAAWILFVLAAACAPLLWLALREGDGDDGRARGTGLSDGASTSESRVSAHQSAAPNEVQREAATDAPRRDESAVGASLDRAVVKSAMRMARPMSSTTVGELV